MIARIAGALAFAAAMLLAAPANAEKLIISLSNHRVLVTSNFVGDELVLFGTIEPDTPRGPVRTGYDVVVTVAGPHGNLRARRKDRVFGIWINNEVRPFINVPFYLAVLSNRAIPDITSTDIARRLQIGLNNFVLTQQVGPDLADTVPTDPFRMAFLRLEKKADLYQENPAGVTFLTPTVFRASIPLPAAAPTGNYTVDVKVFNGGRLVTRGSSALEVVKAGFEQFVTSAAREHGFLYGLATALMALLTGWAASVVFRRD